jgi:hypothetical protein
VPCGFARHAERLAAAGTRRWTKRFRRCNAKRKRRGSAGTALAAAGPPWQAIAARVVPEAAARSRLHA